ncbi:MAG: hypothetical protein J6W28_04775 [Clostridia bacterium]|nr:hypothetical protein [Clostridia bacterium]
MKKILCLFLAVFLLCASLVACNDSVEPIDGGDKNGDWKNLDFGGATLTVSIANNETKKVTFQSASVYTKGPDNAATSEPVQKKVLARNKKVCDDMNMTVAYQQTNWVNGEGESILSQLEKLVAGDAADAPDVFNNSCGSMFQGMLNGYFWNVTNPGRDAAGNVVKNYFDLAHECWYSAYMDGATLSKDKQYILVGDYNIDIVRWAWVLFVNIDRWDATFGSFTEEDGYYNFRNYEAACDFIADTQDWFFDDLIALGDIAHTDGTDQAGQKDKADLTDEQIGVFLSPMASFLFSYYGTGCSVFSWTKNGKAVEECEGVPSMTDDVSTLVEAGMKFTELYNAKSVYNFPFWSWTAEQDCVKEFMNDKAIMATGTLGELESPEMRNTSFKRGILPPPRYGRAASDLITIVGTMAEVSAILNNAKSFALASAYLQYVNEESTEILDFYYEDVLKFKYNESPGARKMIDLITDSVASPCEKLLSLTVSRRAGSEGHLTDKIKDVEVFFLIDAQKNNPNTSTVRSSYDAQRDVMQAALEEIYANFEQLE